MAGQKTPDTTDATPASKISHGTLVVALATPAFIVVATDSRKTGLDGRSPEDNSKKLFRVGKKRVFAIAGLASVSVTDVPGLTEETASVLEDEIDYSASPSSEAGMTDIDDRYWNDPPALALPSSWPEESRQKLRLLDDMPHYVWWVMAEAPVESIVNIAATYHPAWPLENFRLDGLLAGFKDNGEAKLEYMVIIPAWITTEWGLPRVGLSRMWVRLRTNDKLIHRTMGITKWADWVLGGDMNDGLKSLVKGYPAAERFLARRVNSTQDQITEEEALLLCKELIVMTAKQDARVGEKPLQIAVIRPKKDAEVEQPALPRASIFLKPGNTRAGLGFTSDFPFDGEVGTTFTWCEIRDNRVPISLGGNYFYGNKFERATFVYRGGSVHFGINNSVSESTLLVEKGVDESALTPEVLRFFRVQRSQSTK